MANTSQPCAQEQTGALGHRVPALLLTVNFSLISLIMFALYISQYSFREFCLNTYWLHRNPTQNLIGHITLKPFVHTYTGRVAFNQQFKKLSIRGQFIIAAQVLEETTSTASTKRPNTDNFKTASWGQPRHNADTKLQAVKTPQIRNK